MLWRFRWQVQARNQGICRLAQPHKEEKIPSEIAADREYSERILIVEDDEKVLSFASSALRKNGYIVVEATTAEEALDIFRSYQPDDGIQR